MSSISKILLLTIPDDRLTKKLCSMTASIEFKLFAPNNKGAALIGSFSNWKEVPMKKAEDGYFRTKVELDDGINQYKFRVQSQSPTFEPDQWVDIIGPYTTEVDETKNYGVARIKDGTQIVDSYLWQHDEKLLPNNHEIVIYEMHIADFLGAENDSKKRGKYQDAIEKLDYLSELGIKAIELMPVNAYPARGVPMLWMGEEFGEHKGKSKTVTQPKKNAWKLLEKELNQDLFEHYKKLIGLRKQNPALSSNNIDFFQENPEAKVLAYTRWQEQGSRAVVVVNFSDSVLETVSKEK